MPVDTFDSVERCVEAILDRVGRRLVVATPLGIGKPNHLLNQLYRRADADPALSLRIITALSLERPHPKSELERRLLDPLMDRLLGRDYPTLAYLAPRHANRLPSNIEVIEFYFPPAAELTSAQAQQSYISTNYTDVLRDVQRFEPNVLVQLVAGPRVVDGVPTVSLSSNTDLSLDLLDRYSGDPQRIVVGQTNDEMPFLGGDAAVPLERFDLLLDHSDYQFRLFGPPNDPISVADHWIGLHASVLVRDAGTLQLGIGALSDAVAYQLIQRHRSPDTYQATVAESGIGERYRQLIDAWGGTEPFTVGLYANTEMLVDGFLHLLRAGVLKRRAYDDVETQLRADRGEPIDAEHRGSLAHAGFFLGPRSFYRGLRELSEEERAAIAMTRIGFVNTLYGEHEELKRAHRRNARFFNSALMVTLLGAAVSDALEDGRVLSGVGGQYNFVSMANALADGRSILMLRATHRKGRELTSNLRWSYGHNTIPRYLRDLVITEYGIADVRGKTDREIILELLAITDARFQDELLAEAKRYGKLRADDRIAERWRANRPERLERFVARHQEDGLFPALPFGTDLTDEELALAKALRGLQQDVAERRFVPHVGSLRAALAPPAAMAPYLERMQLERPRSLRERALRLVVAYALARHGGLES